MLANVTDVKINMPGLLEPLKFPSFVVLFQER